MKQQNHKRSGIFLLEIMIAILFFALTGAVCLRTFVKAHTLSTQATETFIFIYAGAYLSLYFGNLIPASPAPLQGLKGALQLYGGLASALLPLCALGVVSCLVRKYVIR